MVRLKINLCKCGCGELVAQNYKRGHRPGCTAYVCGEIYKCAPYAKDISKYCSMRCLWDSQKVSRKGSKHTPESIEKIRKAARNRIVSEETKRKISEAKVRWWDAKRMAS